MTARDWRGFDTETQGGRAVLLGTDRGTLDFPRGIAAAFAWLASQGSRFVAWNMDYDARALVALLPRRLWRELHLLGRAVHQGVTIHYLKSKRFLLSDEHRKVAIYDAQQFYGGRLDARAREILGEGKADIPRAWYSRMGDLLRGGGPRAETIRRYCQRDADLARRLYLHVADQFRQAHVRVDEPLSPAYVAATRFRRRLNLDPGREANDALRRAYYGARIELWRRGRVGAWRTHDIRSAYPAALQTAPDPRRGVYISRRGSGLSPHPEAIYGAYDCAVDVPRDCAVPPLPYRSKHGLAYPVGQWRAWYDLETVQEYRTCIVAIHEAHEILDPSARPLFPDLGVIYEERKRRPECSLALKLLLNGLYGRIAMTIDRPYRVNGGPVTDETFWVDGDPWETSEEFVASTHFGVASYVTSRARIALARAMALASRRVIACATDAVYWTGTGPVRGIHPAPVLGGWDDGDAGSDSVWIQPGVYSLRAEGEWHDRVRGFRAMRPLVECLDVRRRVAHVPVSWINTLGHVARGADPDLFNVIRPWRRSLDPNADWKRSWPADWRLARDTLRGSQDSRPLEILPES